MEDLRNPIGLFFVLLGSILLTQSEAHAALTEVTVNLYTGVPMIVFGLGMLGLAYRGKKSGG